MIACCYLLHLLPASHLSSHAGSSVWAIDVPTWITAIATVGLLAGAIFTAIYATRAFREQAKEIAILTKENNRQADERRRTQATKMFIGVPHDPPRLVQPYAQNASDYPIFDTQFCIPSQAASPAPTTSA